MCCISVWIARGGEGGGGGGGGEGGRGEAVELEPDIELVGPVCSTFKLGAKTESEGGAVGLQLRVDGGMGTTETL